MVARLRGRNFDETEIEQAAMAATRQATASTSVPEPAIPLPTATSPRAEVAWGSSEFGNAWSSSGSAEPSWGYGGNGQPPAGLNGTNNAYPKASSGDPWTSSW